MRIHPFLSAFVLLVGPMLLGGCPSDEPDDDDSAVADDDDSAEGPSFVVHYVDDIGDDQTGNGSEDDPFRRLQDAIDAAGEGDVIHVLEGIHTADVTEAVDPTCGNCDDADFRQDIPMTLGFHVTGKSLRIEGESRDGTVLRTGAGYGLLFEEAGTSELTNLTVTGGVRDANGAATDAAIVVKHTALTVRDVDVHDNNDLYDGEPDPVVGIIGIAGREGAVLTVVGCHINNSSWDGIALYRGDPEITGSSPVAVIVANTIGCTDDCIYYTGGRGVAIGITWDAQATVLNNTLHDYWKGIGTFGTSHALVTNNVVRDMHGWGVIASSDSTMDAVNNVVYRIGNCGMAAWDADASGSFVNNVVTGCGHVDEWVAKNTGVWMNSDGVTLSYNDVWDNSGQDVCTGGSPDGADCTPVEFEGIDGNISVDPQFQDTEGFELDAGSQLIDTGDPQILDTDGSRSDMGARGGPDAGVTEPPLE